MSRILYFLNEDCTLDIYDIVKEVPYDSDSVDLFGYNVITSSEVQLYFTNKELRKMKYFIYYDKYFRAWCTFVEDLAIKKWKQLLENDTGNNN